MHMATTYERDAERFTEMLAGISVAPEETKRLQALIDEVEALAADKQCHDVAVGTGTVTKPSAFTATMRSLNGETTLVRLLPSDEMYTDRLRVGDQIVVVIVSCTKAGQFKRECTLFKR